MQKWIIFIIILVILILGVFVVLNVEIETEYVPEAEVEEQDLRKTIISLYFKNLQTNSIVEETRLIDSKELLKSPYEVLIKLLMRGPENSNNIKVIPDNIRLIDVNFENGVVIVNFDSEFDNLNQEEKDLVFETVYNTLTKLTEVTNIRIIVNGNDQEKNNQNSINQNNIDNKNEKLINSNVTSNIN